MINSFKFFKYIFKTALLTLVFATSLGGIEQCPSETDCTINVGDNNTTDGGVIVESNSTININNINVTFGNNNRINSSLNVAKSTDSNISNINVKFGDMSLLKNTIITISEQGNISNTAITFGNDAEIDGNLTGANVNNGNINDTSIILGNDASIIDSLMGAQTSNGNINNTNLHIDSNATIGSNLIGANVVNGNINETKITLGDNAYVFDDLIGAKTNGNVNNSIIILNGTAEVGGDIIGGVTSNGGSTGHKIYLKDSIITNRIIGGHITSGTSTSKATNNLIHIDAEVNMTKTTLYGGLSNGAGDVLTGNTLYFSGKKGVFKEIVNFEFIDISLENTSNQPINANDPILVLADKNTTTDLSNTTISLKTNNNNITNIKIFEKVDGNITAPKNAVARTLKGISTMEEFKLDANGRTLTATKTANNIQEKSQNINTAAMSEAESLLSGNDVIDLIFLGKSIKSNTLETFGMIRGGAIETTSGANTSAKTVNLIAGVGKNISDNAQYGVFFEGGYGSYASETSTAHGISNGKGSNTYYGAGLLLSSNLTSSAYLEASFRIGQIKTDYASDNLGLDATPVSANFNTTKLYYSAHIGAGNVFEVTKDSNVDLYVKAYYGQIGKDDVTLQANDKLSFSAVNSLIGKVGARYNYNIASNFALYGGASYEYEALGDIKTTTSANVSYLAPNDKRSTFAIEGGTQILPTSSDNVILNIHAKYLMGARQGIAGSLKGTYRF